MTDIQGVHGKTENVAAHKRTRGSEWGSCPCRKQYVMSQVALVMSYSMSYIYPVTRTSVMLICIPTMCARDHQLCRALTPSRDSLPYFVRSGSLPGECFVSCVCIPL